MAQIQDSTHKTKPRSSCFLGCFGLYGKVPQKKPPDTVKPRSRKKTGWFSCSPFRIKKSDIKTVPVDATVSEKADRSIQIHADKKITSKRHIPATVRIPAEVPDQKVHEKHQKTRNETAQNIILEVGKSLDDVGSLKNDTCCKRLSFGRKTEVGKTGGSHPGSPETRRSKPSQTISKLSHSVSLPPPRGKKQATDLGGNSRGHREKPRTESDALAGKSDAVVGLPIIVVTLVIMLVWGRLCAILCTSAWFYFVPRLRNATRSRVSVENGSNRIDSDLNYEEHKKKVVLEGFLQRNHRNSLGNL